MVRVERVYYLGYMVRNYEQTETSNRLQGRKARRKFWALSPWDVKQESRR